MPIPDPSNWPPRAICGLICALNLAFVGTPLRAEPDATSTVTIAAAGQSDWRVLSPSLPTVGIPWAVEEARKYMRLMTECDLPRVDAAAPADPTLVIALRADLSAADQAALPSPAKGYDGYSIVIQPSASGRPPRIIVAGDNARGTIYGVYDLLEHCGCRWFYPAQNPADPEVVPHRATLALPAGSWAVASSMQRRICNGSAWFFDMNLTAAAQELDWAMKNRYNGIGWQCADKTPLIEQFASLRKAGLLDELKRRGMFLHGPAHSFQLFLRAEDYLDEHPEWFGLRDGKRVPQNFFGAQFCWSNAQARRKFIDHVEQFVLASPELDVLCIVPFDGGRACECAECKRIGASSALMLLMKETIERLEHSAPQVRVETVGGYGPMTDPPNDVDIHPHQGIVWAHWGRHYGSGYDDPAYPLRANLEAWQKAAQGGFTVCQYYTDNFAEPWILPPFALAIQGDRCYFLARGIDSVYMLMWSPGYWWNHSLNGYLAGHCFYDAALDPFQLLHDYALNYYGPAAGPLIGKYYEQWAREIDLAYRVRGDSLPQHWKLLAEQRRNWIDPAMKAVQGDPVLTARVARVEKLHDIAERLCAVHRHRYHVQMLRERGDFAQARRELDAARTCGESVLYRFYALADLEQGLIERKDIGFLPKIIVLDWTDAESKAIADQSRQIIGVKIWKDIPESELLPTTQPNPD